MKVVLHRIEQIKQRMADGVGRLYANVTDLDLLTFVCQVREPEPSVSSVTDLDLLTFVCQVREPEPSVSSVTDLDLLTFVCQVREPEHSVSSVTRLKRRSASCHSLRSLYAPCTPTLPSMGRGSCRQYWGTPASEASGMCSHCLVFFKYKVCVVL